MSQKYTNELGLSASMLAWLANDDYNNEEGIPEELLEQYPLISVTTLIKPVRQTVLEARLDPKIATKIDVSSRIASRIGTAVHDAVEAAWTNGKTGENLVAAGMPKGLTQKLEINPETPDPQKVPVYLEQRSYRIIDGVLISGKFDFVVDGKVEDNKCTSVFGYLNGSNDLAYSQQGSMYRWLRPEIVTADVLQINYIFTDYSKMMAKTVDNYPPASIHQVTYPLMGLQETESWIRGRIGELRRNGDLPEPEIVRCSDEELWMTAPKFKYYSTAAAAQKQGRANRVFDSAIEAAAHQRTKGKGVVVTVPGAPKRCSYCPVFDLCSQKDEYSHE